MEVARAVRPRGNDVGHHFVPQHTGHRRVASAAEGLQVAATDRGTADAHNRLAAAWLRNGKALLTFLAYASGTWAAWSFGIMGDTCGAANHTAWVVLSHGGQFVVAEVP